jgi:hypothetical protein
MFGTSRTPAESFLDIVEGVIAIVLARILTYFGTKFFRYFWPRLVIRWQECSAQKAMAAAASISEEINFLIFSL